MNREHAIDPRVLKSLEAWLGFPFPTEAGSRRCLASPSRTESPFNRFVINLIEPSHALQVSTTDALLPNFVDLFDSYTPSEVFSEFGLSQICRVLGNQVPAPGTGFSFFLTELTDLNPFQHQDTIRASEASPGNLRLESLVDGELAGWAEVYARDESGCKFIDLEVVEAFRGKGKATALAYEATVAILREGGVARYGAEKSNFASLRIAKRLGYRLCSQHIVG